MLSRSADPIDIGARIAAAQRFREKVVTDSTAYRLVHAEADALPGLIVDRYGDCFAVQMLDQGMDKSTGEIVAALSARFSPDAIVGRNDAAVRSLEELPREVNVLEGELQGPLAIRMNGFRMEADLLTGQKTGVYLDQRENYLAAADAMPREKPAGALLPREVSRCTLPEAASRSRPSIRVPLARSPRRNGTPPPYDVSNVSFREADVFDVLSSYASARRGFAAIALDPPAFKEKSR